MKRIGTILLPLLSGLAVVLHYECSLRSEPVAESIGTTGEALTSSGTTENATGGLADSE